MSKRTDIKYRIDQLDGGAFQNLCDVYLACRSYGTGYSLGMKTGTDKTAKGNPDTYFLTANGKYVFVMYTTQKEDFVNKTLVDLQKCLQSYKYRIFHVLNGEHREMLHLGFQKYREWHKRQVQQLVQQYGLLEYQYLLQVCKECLETFDCKARLLSFGVECAIEASSANQTLYLKCTMYSHHEDYEGQFLAEIVKRDPDFLFCYLDKILEKAPRFYSSRDEWINRLEFIWQEDCFILFMEQISDYIFISSQEI